MIDVRQLRLTYNEAEEFYRPQHYGKPYYEDLASFMSSGPILSLILSGENALEAWRVLMGPASPDDRPSWSIRGKYAKGYPIMQNLVHGSDSAEALANEAKVISNAIPRTGYKRNRG
jgi:nucleoside-diphosphate kinase